MLVCLRFAYLFSRIDPANIDSLMLISVYIDSSQLRLRHIHTLVDARYDHVSAHRQSLCIMKKICTAARHVVRRNEKLLMLRLLISTVANKLSMSCLNSLLLG